MTVSTAINKKSYAGDGATVVFPVPFLFLANSHVVALLRDSAGAEVTWVEGTQYSLTGAGTQSGGSLAVSTSPVDYTPATGESLVITRVVPETQETDYPEGGVFPASAHEQALDKLTMAVQQHSEELGRALVVPVSDKAASLALPIDSVRASKFLSFDSTGQPIAADGTSANLGPVSTYINGLLDDADAATARTTLGAMQDVFTARGDLLFEGAAGEVRLAVGVAGRMLGSDGTDPTWQVVPLPRGYLTGYGLANNATDATNDIDIAGGGVRDSANAKNITLAAAVTRQLDAAFGTGNGGLSSSLTKAASTVYAVHAVLDSAGGASVGFDTSVTAANLVADHGVTAYRRIGWIMTDGASAIIAFTQVGDEFYLASPPRDVNATNPGAAAVTWTATAPPSVLARLHVGLDDGGTTAVIYVSPLFATDLAPSLTAAPLGQVSGNNLALAPDFSQVSVELDSARQARYRINVSVAGTLVQIVTTGWQDRRGRDD